MVVLMVVMVVLVPFVAMVMPMVVVMMVMLVVSMMVLVMPMVVPIVLQLPLDLAEHVHVQGLHAFPCHKHRLALISYLLPITWLGNKLGCMCVLGMAHHLALEHGAFAAGNAMAWVRGCACLPVLLARAIPEKVTPAMMMFRTEGKVNTHLVHALFDPLHLALESMFVVVARVMA